MTLSEYCQLITCIVSLKSNNRHSEIMSSIKECFRGTINSVRRFEQITSIGQLLKVLEVRDLLSEDNVECLKSIALKLPNSQEVLQKITDYESNHLMGGYASLQQSHRKEPEDSFISSSPMCSLSKRKRQRIFDTIIREIGSCWRDLARYLKVCEDIIKDIDIQSITLDEKVTKLMERLYIADTQRWVFLLCDALERTQRRDLVRSIQDIMVMNG